MNSSVKNEIDSVIAQTNKIARTAGWARLAGAFRDRSLLFKLLTTLATTRFALELDSEADGLGRERVDPNIIEEILRHRGMDISKQTRKKLNNELTNARKLTLLCGAYDGLLCFIPSECLKEYSTLSPKSIRTLHRFLDHETTKTLCSIGRMFQASIFTGTVFPPRRFETRS